MATIRVGKLGLTTRPIQLLADWRKVREYDWPTLNMGFTDLAVWDCETQKMMPELPARVALPFSMTSSYITPLGRHDKEARQKRYDRFVGWSGLGSAKAFGAALSGRFKTPTLPVPKKDIERELDKRYRCVIGYRRLDRFLLVVPDRPNPQGDYLILCVPDRVVWYIVRVGICGFEEERVVDSMPLSEGTKPLPIKEWFFVRPGPYRKITPPRVEGVNLPGIYPGKFNSIYHDIPTKVKSTGWRKLLRDDEAQKRALAKKFGGSAGQYGRWSFLHQANYTLLSRRWDAIEKRLARKYG